MIKIRKIHYLLIVLLISAAVIFILQKKGIIHLNLGQDSMEYPIEGQTEEGFENGTYCADVTYYNPNTGTVSEYTLEVEVKNNSVIQINFGNGGWLDEDHMTAEVLNGNGECTIVSDRDYEYTILITGRNCSSSDNINPETDEDMPRYTFMQCAQRIGMTQKEIDKCLSENYSNDQILSENGYRILEKYVLTIRSIAEQYQREIKAINGSQNQMQQEIRAGYVQRIERKSIYGSTIQTVTISKYGTNYLFEVRGGAEVTMGTAQFDESINGWQTVYIKQYPNIEKYSGYSMRIIDSGF